MTYIHDTVIREYLDGKIIQKRNNGKWLDLPSLTTMELMPTFSVFNEYRVKPSPLYFFFHVGENSMCMLPLTVQDYKLTDFEALVFPYPTYEPSGPHIMYMVIDEQITQAKYSPSSTPAISEHEEC